MSRVLKTGECRITQGFSNQHQAVDVVKSPSSLDTIVAHSDGEVVYCQTGHKNNKGSTGMASYGNFVRISHGNGYFTLYAHLSDVFVKFGEKVKKGQEIGYMGNTGNSYGAHLHFEVRKHGQRIDPTPYLNADLPLENAPDVIYAAHVKGGKWLEDVTNYNDKNADGYAGITGKGIDGIRARLTRGNIVYRVHLIGDINYLDWVRNIEAAQNGYAGIYGRGIDGVQMFLEGVSGYAVEYRVAPVGEPYLAWVRNHDDNSPNGYAGIYGKELDRIQIRIVKV